MKFFLVVLEDRQITGRHVSKRNEVIANAAAVSVMRINYWVTETLFLFNMA